MKKTALDSFDIENIEAYPRYGRDLLAALVNTDENAPYGYHFYRERFAERGFFYKVPAVLRDYLSAIPVKINEKARYKPGIASYHNIITCGFSTLSPYIRQQPLAMQQ